jgi:YhcH/YjgK/YiaL family protein
MVLAGEEYAFWYPLTGLKLHTPYDPQTDVAFYEPQPKAGSQSILKRGIIAVFFPEDAHMPSVSIQATPSIVKKVVIKIAIESMGK